MNPRCAADVMQEEPLVLAPDMPFLELQHLFVVAQISGAPVGDAAGKIVGMVSCADLVRAVDQLCDDEVDSGPELTERLGALRARDIATPDVVWVAPETPISEVAALMHQEGIHRVLVGNDGKLLGIVTAFDLLEVQA